MCETLEDSDHTSVQCRLKERSESDCRNRICSADPLKPVAGIDADALLGMTEADYLDLVQWTGEQASSTKASNSIGQKKTDSEQPPEAIWSLARHPKQWMRRVQGTESHYYRAIGSAEALMAKTARPSDKRWMKGVSANARG